MDALERIRSMEEILQGAKPVLAQLDAALEVYAAQADGLRALARYYGGEDWRADLALDEAGLLPPTLRRGVLSEDEVYDLLCDERRIRDQMRRLLDNDTETEENT